MGQVMSTCFKVYQPRDHAVPRRTVSPVELQRPLTNRMPNSSTTVPDTSQSTTVNDYHTAPAKQGAAITESVHSNDQKRDDHAKKARRDVVHSGGDGDGHGKDAVDIPTSMKMPRGLREVDDVLQHLEMMADRRDARLARLTYKADQIDALDTPRVIDNSHQASNDMDDTDEDEPSNSVGRILSVDHIIDEERIEQIHSDAPEDWHHVTQISSLEMDEGTTFEDSSDFGSLEGTTMQASAETSGEARKRKEGDDGVGRGVSTIERELRTSRGETVRSEGRVSGRAAESRLLSVREGIQLFDETRSLQVLPRGEGVQFKYRRGRVPSRDVGDNNRGGTDRHGGGVDVGRRSSA